MQYQDSLARQVKDMQNAGPGSAFQSGKLENRPRSESEQALDHLNSLINQAQGNVARLHSRLEAAVRPYQERSLGAAIGGGQCEKAPARCQLVSNIEAASARLADLNADIESLIDSIGI